MSSRLSPQRPEYEQSEKARDGTPDPKDQRQFWIALLAPAPLALIGFPLGKVSFMLAWWATMLAFVVGTISAIFCGVWVARRLFIKSLALRILYGLFFIVGIGFTYFIIICAAWASFFSH